MNIRERRKAGNTKARQKAAPLDAGCCLLTFSTKSSNKKDEEGVGEGRNGEGGKENIWERREATQIDRGKVVAVNFSCSKRSDSQCAQMNVCVYLSVRVQCAYVQSGR